MKAIRISLAFLVCGLAAAAAPGHAAKSTPKPAAAAKPPAEQRMDINSATQIQLEKLPGIDRPTAKRIIAGRPYLSVNDLSRVGVSKATIQKITPLAYADMSMPAGHDRLRAKPRGAHGPAKRIGAPGAKQ